MTKVEELEKHVREIFADKLQSCVVARNELTIEIAKQDVLSVCQQLRDDVKLQFDMLIDVCGVDYLCYGVPEWDTKTVTTTGFSRGVESGNKQEHKKPRFAVVYHLLSIAKNHRIRVRTFVDGEPLMLDSVVDIWNAADWFEREAFDLYGILFKGHPDLRRILTDYGFVGYPFRKDFPLSGNVEVRYDATQGRVIYEPVDIEPRVLVPKVIR